jgi:hypothetical protein
MGAAFYPVGHLADMAGCAIHPVPKHRVRQLVASHVMIVSFVGSRMQAILVGGKYGASPAIGLPRLQQTMAPIFRPSFDLSDNQCSALGRRGRNTCAARRRRTAGMGPYLSPRGPPKSHRGWRSDALLFAYGSM